MMPKIHEKIMQTNFTKKLKKLIILTVCVVLLGGGVSTAMLAPQIREAVSGARQWEQDREKRREQDNGENCRCSFWARPQLCPGEVSFLRQLPAHKNTVLFQVWDSAA